MARYSKQFSVEDKLKALVHLQKVSSKLDELLLLKGELPEWVDNLRKKIQRRQEKQSQLEAEMNGMKAFELEERAKIKDLEQIIQRDEARREEVKSSKEFESIEKQIEHNIIQIKMLERSIRNTQDDMEQKKLQWEDLNEKIADSLASLELKEEELKKAEAITEIDEKELQQEIALMEKHIDAEEIRIYRRIRKNYKNGLAVVPVLREACGGCFSFIPPQKQIHVAQCKNIITCENCGRILVGEALHNEVNMLSK